MCGDLTTQCSLEIPISVLKEKLAQSQDSGGSHLAPSRQDSNTIRMCRDCKDTMFARRNFQYQTANTPTPELIKLFMLSERVRQHISSKLLPEFEDSLLIVEDPQRASNPTTTTNGHSRTSSNTSNHINMGDATTARKKLMDAFVQYDSLAKRFGACRADTDVEKRLQARMTSVAEQFLQDTMVPLRAVPKVLKRQPNTDFESSNNNINDSKPLQEGESHLDRMSRRARRAAEVKEQQDQLIVLQEQEFLVRNMIDEAKKGRRFDEVGPLMQSVQELQTEIEKIQNLLHEDGD